MDRAPTCVAIFAAKGLAVITGTEDRQHAYVALTRGTDANLAYVFTVAPEMRRPGTRPEAGSRAGPVRQNLCRTIRRPRPGHPARPGGPIAFGLRTVSS